jgi:hypothetical protein
MIKSSSSQSISSLLSLNHSFISENDEQSEFDTDTDFIQEHFDYFDSDIEMTEEEQNSSKDKSVLKEATKIFLGSPISLKQFCFLFLYFAHKMKIAANQRQNLFRFLTYLLPEDNNLPRSYASLLKKYFTDQLSPKIIKNCYFCETSLVEGICTNVSCDKPHSIPKGVKTAYETIIFDAEHQLVDVLERNWKQIEEYKGIIQNNFINEFIILQYFLIFLSKIDE